MGLFFDFLIMRLWKSPLSSFLLMIRNVFLGLKASCLSTILTCLRDMTHFSLLVLYTIVCAWICYIASLIREPGILLIVKQLRMGSQRSKMSFIHLLFCPRPAKILELELLMNTGHRRVSCLFWDSGLLLLSGSFLVS